MLELKTHYSDLKGSILKFPTTFIWILQLIYVPCCVLAVIEALIIFVSTLDYSAFRCGQMFWLLNVKIVFAAVQIHEFLVNMK